MPQQDSSNKDTPDKSVLMSNVQFSNQIINLGVSTSALFDTRDEEKIFKTQGELAYMTHMRKNANQPFAAGTLLPFIQKMMNLNKTENFIVNLTILSKSNPQVAERVHKSLYAHGLSLERHAFRFGVGEAYMKGRPITPALLRSFGVDIFLSPDANDVKQALKTDLAAGQTFPVHPKQKHPQTKDILIAFDFDRVMCFGQARAGDKYQKDSEAFFQENGLTAYWKREAYLATHPASRGPLASIYFRLALLRDYLRTHQPEHKLELAIVTARSSDPLRRVLTTLAEWGNMNVEPDYLLSVGCTPKTGCIQELQADAFFDDSLRHIESAAGITAAILVPYTEPEPPNKSKINKLYPSDNYPKQAPTQN